jgi:hypothetical protein
MTPTTGVTLIRADHETIKRLGTWTTDRTFDVRARRSTVVLDLRSPHLGDGDLDAHRTGTSPTVDDPTRGRSDG